MDSRGFSKSKLARELKTTASTVGRWFEGSVPQDIRLAQLCAVLGVSESWLMRGIEPLAEFNAEPCDSVLREDPVPYKVRRLVNSDLSWVDQVARLEQSILIELKACTQNAASQDLDAIRHLHDMAVDFLDDYFAACERLSADKPQP